MVHRLRARDRRAGQRGAVAILVAIMSLVLFTICGLVVDLGQARVTRRHAQNAADAAALAAGNALYLAGTKTPDLAAGLSAAEQYADENYGVTAADWKSCTDPGHLAYLQDPDVPCISFDSPTAPLRVRVRLPQRSVKTPFGGLLGTDHVDIAAASVAKLVPGGMADCGLCLVGEGLHALQNGNVEIDGANIDFNGDVTLKNQGVVVSGGQINIEGTATTDQGTWTPTPKVGQPRIDDPLAGLKLPRTDRRGAAAEERPVHRRARHLRRPELLQRHVHPPVGALRHHR